MAQELEFADVHRMTDYLAQARQYVKERHGDQVSVLLEHIVDSDRFYCFTFQSNEYLRTNDISTMLVGHGYTIINKKDNRFFTFGSKYHLNTALEVLEENLAGKEVGKIY